MPYRFRIVVIQQRATEVEIWTDERGVSPEDKAAAFARAEARNQWQDTKYETCGIEEIVVEETVTTI